MAGGRPPTFQDYVNYAHQLKAANDFESSVIAATLALKLNPNSSDAYAIRASAKYYSTETVSDEPLKDMQMAARLDPKNPEAHRLLGMMYAAKKEYQRSADEFSQALKLGTIDRDIYRHRAAALSALDKKKEALADLDSFIQLKKQSPLGYRLKAGIYETMRDDKNALACYDKALQFADQSDHDGVLNLRKERGSLLAKLGKLKEARDDFTKVLETDSDDEDAWRMRGDVLMQLGKYKEAAQDYTKAVDKSPYGYARLSYEARSNAYKKLGEFNLASADLDKAKKEREKPAEEKIYEMK